MVFALKVLGIGCLCAAMICSIVALATTNWMTACLPFAKLLGGSSLSGSLIQFKDASYCVNTGLFNIAVEMHGTSLSSKATLKYIGSDAFIKATAALLIIGVIFFVVALAGLILAYRSDNINVERKIASHVYSKVAVSIILFGCLLFGAGMVTYQVGQSSVVHNPLLYFAQINPSLSSVTNQPASNNEISSLMNSFREDPFKSLDNQPASNNEISSFNNLFGQDVPGRKRRQSGYPNWYSNLENNENYGLSTHSNSLSDINANSLSGLSFLKNLDVAFNYSLYVAWLSWVLAVISLVVNSVVIYFSKKYKNGSQSIPVLQKL